MSAGAVPLFGDPDETHLADLGERVAAGARATIAALDELGLIEARHAASAALVLTLADAIDQLNRFGGTRKGTPLALLAREMRESLAVLPEPPVDVDQGWSDLAEELRAAVRHPS